MPLIGPLLWNRLLWLGVAAALLSIAYGAYHFEVRGKKAKQAEKLAAQNAAVRLPPRRSPSFAPSQPSAPPPAGPS